MYRRAQAGGVALGFAGQQGHLGGQFRGQGLPDHQRQGRLGIPTGLLGGFAADQLLNGRGQGGKPHIPQGVLRGRSRKARHERHAFRGRSHGRKGGQLQGIRHQNQQGDALRAVLRGLLGNQRPGGGLSHGSVRLRGCRFRGLGGSSCRDGILRRVRRRGRGGCLRRRFVPGGSGCLGRNRRFAGGFGLGGCFCRDWLTFRCRGGLLCRDGRGLLLGYRDGRGFRRWCGLRRGNRPADRGGLLDRDRRSGCPGIIGFHGGAGGWPAGAADGLEPLSVPLRLAAHLTGQAGSLREAGGIRQDHRTLPAVTGGLFMAPFHLQPRGHQRVGQGLHGFAALAEDQGVVNLTVI